MRVSDSDSQIGDKVGKQTETDFSRIEARGLGEDDPDSLISSVIAYRYKLLECIGTGGMSTVYRAKHLLLNQDVALKLIRTDRLVSKIALKRFMQEAQSAMVLSHPNIASMREFGEHDGRPYLVMDFVNGTNLAQKLQKDFRPNQTWILNMAIQLCEGLEHAHGKGIIHRDLKPANLIVVNEPKGGESIKIIDFGLAKKLQNDAPNLTREGEVFGTPMYMSPEQCFGDEVDQRADLYSVGCILYELIEGWPPFTSDKSQMILMMHVNTAPPKLTADDVGEDLKSVVLKCLAKDADDRYQSASELRLDLERIRAGERPQIVEETLSFVSTSTDVDALPAEVLVAPESTEVQPIQPPSKITQLRYHAVGVSVLSLNWLIFTRTAIEPWLKSGEAPGYWLIVTCALVSTISLYVSIWGQQGGKVLFRHFVTFIKHSWTIFAAAFIFWLFFRQSP